MTAVENASPRRVQIVAAARELLESEGLEAITMRRLGMKLGMRGPSIYKHVPDKAAIQTELVALCFTEQAAALDGVATEFASIAAAYRSWATQHPHAHRLLNEVALDRSLLPEGLEERAAAPLIAACGGDLALSQAAWATVKGLVDLEVLERFPPGTDINAAYQAAARAFDAVAL